MLDFTLSLLLILFILSRARLSRWQLYWEVFLDTVLLALFSGELQLKVVCSPPLSTSSSNTMAVTKKGRGWCPKWSMLGSCSRVRGGVGWEIDRQADVVHGGEERSQHKSEAVDLLVYLYPCGHELWVKIYLKFLINLQPHHLL